MLLGYAEQLLHKITPLRLREVAISPCTYSQTQRDKKNEETEEYVPNQKRKQILKELKKKKDLNETKVSNLSDKKFKVIVIKIFGRI